MRNVHKFFLYLILTVIFLIPSAWAGGGLELVGAGTYTLASGSPAPAAGFGFGGGAILDLGLNYRTSFQLGGLYLSSVYSNPDPQTFGVIRALGGLRFLLSPGFGFNFGGYYNLIISNPQSLSGNDFGAYAGLVFHFRIGPTTGIVLNPMYCYSLGSLTAPSVTLVPHQFLVLAGLTFGML